jgi:hypothetical protein
VLTGADADAFVDDRPPPIAALRGVPNQIDLRLAPW